MLPAKPIVCGAGLLLNSPQSAPHALRDRSQLSQLRCCNLQLYIQLQFQLPVQVVNDYDRDVFNGDQGFVVGVLPDGALDVEFPPAQPSAGAAAYGKQPPPGNPADAPGATLASVAPASSGAASGQVPQGAEVPPPMPPRRLQYLGRQVMFHL